MPYSNISTSQKPCNSLVCSAKKPYPFGMTIANRSISNNYYRYSFNGMEKLDEIYGESNAYDFGARMYDSRLGRWFSVDAIIKPYLSSYQFGSDNPIIFIDPDGNTEFYFNGKWVGSDGIDNNLIGIVNDKKVAKAIKQSAMDNKEVVKTFQNIVLENGLKNNNVFFIDKDILSGANETLNEALENGETKEFGLGFDKVGNKFKRKTANLIQGSNVPLESGSSATVNVSGDVTIHSHRTGVGTDGSNANADKPSGSDKAAMLNEDMTIIVGKKGQVVKTPEGGISDWRKDEGTIEIYNKTHRDKSIQSIGGKEADKILKDHSPK